MSNVNDEQQIRGQIRLDGGGGDEERPSVVLHALGEGDEVLISVDVDEGSGEFELPVDVLSRARRIVLADRDADPTDTEVTYRMRTHTFRRMLDVGPIGVPAPAWRLLLTVRRCVDATISRCYPYASVIDGVFERVDTVGGVPGRIDPGVFVPPPLFRCAPICDGVVDVYRRTCCSIGVHLPPAGVEPRLLPPPITLPDSITSPPPFPDPFPPVPDDGRGGPVPFDVLDTIVTGGAIDIDKVRTLAARRAVDPDRRLEIDDRIDPPFPLETCGGPVFVGSGFVGAGGRIHVCWTEPLRSTDPRCRDEYAFVVKQNIAGRTVTIYDGPAAGQWYPDGVEPSLLSFHPDAIGCRTEEFPVPVDGAFAVLQDIGATPSHQLRTPAQDGPDSVAPVDAESGLLEVGADPRGWAIGGEVRLRYHFSESMQDVGARFFRVQVAPATSSGTPAPSDPDDPTSEVAWTTINVARWRTWRSDGTIRPGTRLLSPDPSGPDGALSHLYYIPYETGSPLDEGEEWQDGQYHATFHTTDVPSGTKYLVRLEVFDADGRRIEPPDAAFSFRRWTTPTATAAVPHGALTHLFHVDNRPVVGEIDDVDGPADDGGDCTFFEASSGDQPVTVRFRAYHPATGTPSFMWNYHLSITRGIHGVPAAHTGSRFEVGEGPSAAEFTVPVRDLLPDSALPDARCAFTARLAVHARIHSGSGVVRGYHRSDHASFAVVRSG